MMSKDATVKKKAIDDQPPVARKCRKASLHSGMAYATSGKNSRPRSGKKRRKRMRLPISAVRVKSLAYGCVNLTAADKVAGLDQPLAELIERYDVLAKAWERGQFLQNLEECASAILTISQAAKKLDFEHGQQLRELLDSDIEASNLWGQARLVTIVASKKALVDAAKEGNQAAIRAIEIFLRDEGEASADKSNYDRVTISQLADLFSTTRQTIYEWFTKQQLPRNVDATFDLKSTINWYGEFVAKKLSRTKDILGDRDPLRAIKAEKLALELQKHRGDLLDRTIVIEGQVARYQNLIHSLDRLVRELPMMIVNQPLERVKEILDMWRRDMIVQQQKIPDELLLPNQALKILDGIYELLTQGLPGKSKDVESVREVRLGMAYANGHEETIDTTISDPAGGIGGLDAGRPQAVVGLDGK